MPSTEEQKEVVVDTMSACTAQMCRFGKLEEQSQVVSKHGRHALLFSARDGGPAGLPSMLTTTNPESLVMSYVPEV